MKTRLELIQHCKNAKNWKYVYGCKGEILTIGKYNSLKNAYGSYIWNTDVNKVGQYCCDCSGLISSCTGKLKGSSQYLSTASEKVSIAELKANWNKYVGWGLWLNGHIGVVSDTKGYYYAMDGSASNWVHKPIANQKWVYAIKLCDIDYSTPKYVNYKAHSKTLGWQATQRNGSDAGRIGLRLEAIKIDCPSERIEAKAHIQSKGWVDYGVINSNTVIGTTGQSKRLEALTLKGNIQFRVYIKGKGWTNWVSCYQGATLGTTGQSRPLEAINIKLL